MKKRAMIILCLGWITTLAITTYVAGYYYMQCQDYIEQLRYYSDMYNSLFQNYTKLLQDYVNTTESYAQLLQEYENKTMNYTAQIKKYEAVTMRVNLCLNYGNGTTHWYNDTIILLGYDLLNGTKLIAKVEYTYWPAYDASFVDAINGVSNEHPYYWMWLHWNQNEKTWKYGPVGADRYTLKPDETIMWRYEIPS